jgi:hypothetical protein
MFGLTIIISALFMQHGMNPWLAALFVVGTPLFVWESTGSFTADAGGDGQVPRAPHTHSFSGSTGAGGGPTSADQPAGRGEACPLGGGDDVPPDPPGRGGDLAEEPAATAYAGHADLLPTHHLPAVQTGFLRVVDEARGHLIPLRYGLPG